MEHPAFKPAAARATVLAAVSTELLNIVLKDLKQSIAKYHWVSHRSDAVLIEVPGIDDKVPVCRGPGAVCLCHRQHQRVARLMDVPHGMYPGALELCILR